MNRRPAPDLDLVQRLCDRVGIIAAVATRLAALISGDNPTF